MPSTIDDLHHWMTQKEDEHLEFKEAKGNFHFEKLRDAGRVRLEGTRRWARWFVAGSADYGPAATPRAKEEP